MNPEIYTSEDISLIDSLLIRFRAVIWEEECLYGFTLSDLDEVAEKFPDVDLLDEGANDYDASGDVLQSMFAFVLDNNPVNILKPEEISLVKVLSEKLKNV